MVRINNEYIIDVDENNYTLKKDLQKEDKEGRPLYKTIGYYTNLKSAIKGYLDYKVGNLLSEEEYSLKSAVKCLADTYKEFNELFAKAMGENL